MKTAYYPFAQPITATLTRYSQNQPPREFTDAIIGYFLLAIENYDAKLTYLALDGSEYSLDSGEYEIRMETSS